MSLDHVLWIGGAPRCGKTTLSRLLAGKYDLKLYDLDWHQVREHRDRPGGVPRSRDALSLDARWVHPTPQELLDRAIASWTEGFPLVVEDLRALPRSRPILADGPGAFPWCVAPLLSSPSQGIWLRPTPEFLDEVLLRRRRLAGALGILKTSDPDRAQRNLRERDLALARVIQEKCDELALRCVMDRAISTPAWRSSRSIFARTCRRR